MRHFVVEAFETVDVQIEVFGQTERLADVEFDLGDDAQQIAGAIGTATHGSGAAQQCFSAMATKFRVVLATGEVREVSTEDPHTLAAARVAMGMLGVVTEVELDVREAFGLAENLEYWPVEQVLERFDDEMTHRRHFSFFWMPYDGSPGSLFMDWPASVGPGDCALVKLYDEVPQLSLSSPPRTPNTGGSIGRTGSIPILISRASSSTGNSSTSSLTRTAKTRSSRCGS